VADEVPVVPRGCFGPYRSAALGYSRRELACDFAVHAIGITGGLCGAVLLLMRVYLSTTLRADVAAGIVVYTISLMAMLICSALFNTMVGLWTSSLWALQLADHAGILLLIAGTYTPFLLRVCYLKLLGFIWGVGALSFAAKAARSPLDVVPLHVACFLLMGWAVTPWIPVFIDAFTSPSAAMILGGGCTYTIGLWPWASNRHEYHNAVWHVFVLFGSAIFYIIVYSELAQPERWVHWAGASADAQCM